MRAYPWSHPDEKGDPLDQQEQVNYYEAMFEAFWDEPWFIGFAWWGWPARLCNRDAAAMHRGFCVYGKRAEAVVREGEIDVIAADNAQRRNSRFGARQHRVNHRGSVYVLSSGPMIATGFWLCEATARDGFYAVMYAPLLLCRPNSFTVAYVEWRVELFGTVGRGCSSSAQQISL